jgi:hypothetical protein
MGMGSCGPANHGDQMSFLKEHAQSVAQHINFNRGKKYVAPKNWQLL